MSRRLVAAVLLAAAAVTGLALGPATAAAAVPKLVETDQSYGPSARQVVTLIRPAGAYADRRTVIFIHGGGWTGGSRAIWDAEARAWAARGWVTINMEYRRASLDGQPGDGPEMAQDVLAVYRKYEPMRMTGKFVIVGDSAGGQLATAVGSQLGRANVAGIVAWSPIASPRSMAAHTGYQASTAMQRELGRKAEEFWGADYDAWSAHRYIRTGAAPPMYLVGGTQETYVEWAEQGQTLCTERGFTGVCAPVASDLHGTGLWESPAGAKHRLAARKWAGVVTAGHPPTTR